MRIGRSVCALTALLAVTLAGTSVHAQTRSERQQTPFVKPQDVTVEAGSVEPGSVETVDVDDLSSPTERFERGEAFDDSDAVFTAESIGRDREVASSALLDQVEAEIAEAERRAVDVATAFDQVQRQFVEIDPGEQATVPEHVLERFERDFDELATRFDRIERGFDELGEDRRAAHARQALSALDVLQAQLALLGLRLVKRGERARVANALEFDFELLLKALAALHGPIVVGDREFDDAIIRPPEGVSPTGMLIRPPEGIEPSREIIRPPEGIEPSREIIRPPEGIEPSREIIRPPEGIEPSREIIRPPEGIEPSDDIIRPPTSDNPAVDD